MANFPTSLDTLTNPSGSDKLDSPDHPSQHSTANDILEAVEAKVGIDSSAVTTSHDYKLSGVTGSTKAVSLTGSETLTNKILTSPTLTAAVIATSLDLNGLKLILDADQDTSITTDTDDQIDIEIAGADDFRFTANTFAALSGSKFTTNTIDETTAASGVTIDGILHKDSKVVIDSGERLGVNGSDKTTIGKNSVRATRFVAIAPTTVLDTNPANTDWSDLDFTSATSSTTLAVALNGNIVADAANRIFYIVQHGDGEIQNTELSAKIHSQGTVRIYNAWIQAVSNTQLTRWSVSHAGVSSVEISVYGYWEYVD